jgi:hypothetical protein
MLKVIATVMTLAFLAAVPATAQQLPSMTTQAPTIKRMPLQKFDVPGGRARPSWRSPRSCPTC